MPKIPSFIWTPGIEKMRAFNFFRTIFDFPNIFYTSGTEISKHFQGSFGPNIMSELIKF